MGLTRTAPHDSHFFRRRLPLCPLFLADGDVRLFRLPGPHRRPHRARLLSRGAGDRLLRDADRLVEVREQQFGLVAVSELAGTVRTCPAHQLQAVRTVSVPMTDMRNLDEATVAGFGKEWSEYDQTDLARKSISRMPFTLRKEVTTIIAALVYWPLARLAKLAERMGRDVVHLPLSIYRNRTFYVMRTDALDRFGTRLEHRFTREQIDAMMRTAGLDD